MSDLIDHLVGLGFTPDREDGDDDPATTYIYEVGEFTVRVKVGDYVTYTWTPEGRVYPEGGEGYRYVKPTVAVDLYHQCDEWVVVGATGNRLVAVANMQAFRINAERVEAIVGRLNLDLPHPVGEVMS